MAGGPINATFLLSCNSIRKEDTEEKKPFSHSLKCGMGEIHGFLGRRRLGANHRKFLS